MFVFGRVLCLTGLILLTKIMGMGKLVDKNEETGQGVVMQQVSKQKTDIEMLGNGWFTKGENNNEGRSALRKAYFIEEKDIKV